MWKSFKCRRRTGESGYMGFAVNYENLLSFLLEVPDGDGGDYYQLVRRNREAFETLFSCIDQNVKRLQESLQAEDGTTTMTTNVREGGQMDSRKTSEAGPREGSDSAAGDRGGLKTISSESADGCAIRLVEPRELLNLLNYIEVYNTRLLYVPRPFYRSNIFCMTSLVQMADTCLIACFFCGRQSAYYRSDGSVCFTTIDVNETRISDRPVSTTVVNMYEEDEATTGRVMFNNDLDPGQQEILARPYFERIRDLHHTFCPVMWLHRDYNAVWNQKWCTFTVRGVSKFHHLMQFLTMYPRPREHGAWLCLINRLSKCETPGATQHTLDNLFRIVCHERLVLLATDRVCGLWKGGGTTLSKSNDTTRLTTPSEDVHQRRPRSEAIALPQLGIRVRYEAGTDAAGCSDFYTEPMHVNAYTYDVVNLSDDAYTFDGVQGFQLARLLTPGSLPFGGSHTVLPLADGDSISTRANTLRPHRTVDQLHQQQQRDHYSTYNRRAEDQRGQCSAAFNDGTVSALHYYRLLYLQGFLVPIRGEKLVGSAMTLINSSEQLTTVSHASEHHVCLYCGMIFRNVLSDFEKSQVYFGQEHVKSLLSYALYGAHGERTVNRYVYGRHLPPVSGFEAVFPSDLRVIGDRLEKHHRHDDRLNGALLWLSCSMDSLHADYCVFRMKRRAFKTNYCAICLDTYGDSEGRSMICGHEFCTSCYNEISVTDCCICKRGFRTDQLTTSDSVILGYSQCTTNAV